MCLLLGKILLSISLSITNAPILAPIVILLLFSPFAHAITDVVVILPFTIAIAIVIGTTAAPFLFANQHSSPISLLVLIVLSMFCFGLFWFLGFCQMDSQRVLFC